MPPDPIPARDCRQPIRAIRRKFKDTGDRTLYVDGHMKPEPTGNPGTPMNNQPIPLTDAGRKLS